jgi:hypothetical protein
MNDPDYVYAIDIHATPEAGSPDHARLPGEVLVRRPLAGRWSKGAVVRTEREGGVDFTGGVPDADPRCDR